MKKIILLIPMIMTSISIDSLAQPTMETLHDVSVISEDTVIVIGENGTLLRTTDGGDTWAQQINSAKDFIAIHFIDKKTGWVVGEDGIVRKTTNSGKKWLRLSINAPELLDVFFVDHNIGWVVGINGFIAKSTDGGESWSPQSSGTTERLNGIYYVDPDTGWIAGPKEKILSTVNGGKIWSVNDFLQGSVLLDLCFVDSRTGWAAGGKDGLPDLIYKTTNGGVDWNAIAISNITGVAYASVIFVEAQNGWIVGRGSDGGRILTTTNQGETWDIYCTGSLDGLNSIDFANAQVGWAVGQNGTILKTTDGGSNWMPVQGQLVGVKQTVITIPSDFDLAQNYPNPFSLTLATSILLSQTTIAYELATAAHVSITVYDILGRAIRNLVNAQSPSGVFQVSWNGTDESNQPVASGIYFYRMHVQPTNSSEPLVKQMKMLITK